MGKRGPKPRGKVSIKWSSNFAYAIGLLVSDGCLSSNGRHITFVSKDREQLLNFTKALDITVRTGSISSGYSSRKIGRVQFGDVLFYKFLLNIGLMPNKSKVIGAVAVPTQYFFDFLRGVFDGDGSTHSYWDKRWRSSFMFYVQFASASRAFIDWLQHELYKRLSVKGHVTNARGHSTFQLKYAKRDGLKVLQKMYTDPTAIRLSRKYLKTRAMLGIVSEHL